MRFKGREVIYEGRVIKVLKVAVEQNDGSEVTREVVETRPAVAVLARNPEGRFVLVRQPRPAVAEDSLLEVIAGKVDPGEEPVQAAVRETAEETGMHVEAISQIGLIYPSPGYMSERIYLFAADVVPGIRSQGDADEDIEVVTMSPDAIEALIRGAGPIDGKIPATWAAWKCFKGELQPTAGAIVGNACLGCGMVYYNCLCGHDEE